ncbi:MAG: hypothetical protein J6M02_02295 [Clostridia bacterium]|nr:hypothetical protein [Clostridia bacterium]
MQFKEELLSAAEEIYTNQENKRNQFFRRIQNHAIEQVKNGYTAFRVGSLKQEEERYLEEWGKSTNADIQYICFTCFTSEKKYRAKQYLVNLNALVQLDYESEGKLLVISD